MTIAFTAILGTFVGTAADTGMITLGYRLLNNSGEIPKVEHFLIHYKGLNTSHAYVRVSLLDGQEVKSIADKQGIQILTDTQSGTTAMASLAAQTAVVIESGHATGLLESFLMKRVKATINVKAAVADEMIIIGLARGDATVGQIKAALEDVQLERDRKTQAAKRDVLHETLVTMNCQANSVGPNAIELDISLGGGKGIPFEKGDGWAWFIYNVDDAALSAGSQVVRLNATYYGIWL